MTRPRSAAIGAPTSARCRAGSSRTSRPRARTNPVFMLDEVDKIGMDFRGDPSSALARSPRPEQNNTFQDNYLEVPFDLTKVLFITRPTCSTHPAAAARPHGKSSSCPATTEQEKIEIGKRFPHPQADEEHGLTGQANIAITDEGHVELVPAPTPHEAGVPNLETRDRQRHAQGGARRGRGPQAARPSSTSRSWPSTSVRSASKYASWQSENQIGAASRAWVVTESAVMFNRHRKVTLMEGKEALSSHRPARRR